MSVIDDIGYEFRNKLKEFFKVEGSDGQPLTIRNAKALVDRNRLSEKLTYRGFDSEAGLVVGDDGEKPYLGFGIQVVPVIIAGEEMEDVMETVVTRCPKNVMIQSALHSSPDVHFPIADWLETRLKLAADKPLLKEMAMRRAKFLEEGAWDYSLLPKSTVHTRWVSGYLFFRVPQQGELRNAAEMEKWISDTIDLRDSICGILRGGGIGHNVMDERVHRRVVMQLLNPNFKPKTLDEGAAGYGGFPKNLVRKDNHVSIDDQSALHFKGGDMDRAAVAVTVDSYPEQLSISHTRCLTGDILNREDRITDPYWLFTSIHVMDPDDARMQLNKKLGIINKQTMSDSPWFRAMAQNLYTRRDQTNDLLAATEQRHNICRIMTGIVVFPTADRAKDVGDEIAAMWRKAGYQASVERLIGYPVFLAALPYGYGPDMDTGSEGLCRLNFANSFNAASAMPIASDWKGHSMACGGPTFTSRRGQLASLDLMKEETNYNKTVVAASGSGKSFYSAELICDFLSRGGIVRVIDVGRSYQRLAAILDGQVLEFKPNKPRSINPFWGVTDPAECNENLPMWTETVELMGFPRERADSWMYKQIENGIEAVWKNVRGEMGIKQIWEYFDSQEDPRLKNLAEQLQSYAVGRLAAWFNGPPEVQFRSDFSILELEELNADKNLRTVVLALVIAMILRDMYRYESEGEELVPKLLLIDEAWQLLGRGSGDSANFIEEAARRIRKYRGTLLTITQGYGDYFQSSGAEAALTNSAWRCSLAQSGQSIRKARDEKVIPGGDYVYDIMGTVKRGDGFSEMHICNSAGIGDVFRLIIDPFSYYTYTTNPDDKNAINKLISEGYSTLDAITYLADQQDAKRMKIAA